MPQPTFLYRLKKKDQAHVEKMRETFPQVKIKIPLLDAIQQICLLYTSPSPRDGLLSRMPSSA